MGELFLRGKMRAFVSLLIIIIRQSVHQATLPPLHFQEVIMIMGHNAGLLLLPESYRAALHFI